jgi:FKBP-type peptidyl-prolyl cis-trans isomerase
MKKIFPFLIIALIYLLTSCKTDNYQDWKIMNDAYFASKDTVHYVITGEDSASIFHFETTPSGLKYVILEEGYQSAINPNSYVVLNYTGRFLDYSVFDARSGSDMLLSQAVEGFREGVRLIQYGGHILLQIPYQLGYGTEKNGLIPPYSTLYFDIRVTFKQN